MDGFNGFLSIRLLAIKKYIWPSFTLGRMKTIPISSTQYKKK